MKTFFVYPFFITFDDLILTDEEIEYGVSGSDLIYEEDLENYEFIENDMVYSDLEKGYEEYTVIIKRKSDDKFFKSRYRASPYTALKFLEPFTEVFPQIIQKTVYR